WDGGLGRGKLVPHPRAFAAALPSSGRSLAMTTSVSTPAGVSMGQPARRCAASGKGSDRESSSTSFRRLSQSQLNGSHGYSGCALPLLVIQTTYRYAGRLASTSMRTLSPVRTGNAPGSQGGRPKQWTVVDIGLPPYGCPVAQRLRGLAD